MREASSHRRPLRIETAELRVADLPRVRAFYLTVLGLEEIAGDAASAVLGVGDTELLRLVADPSAPPDDKREAGLFHIAYLLPSRADLGAWLRHAEAQNVRLTGVADHNVSQAVYLDDPEGNGVEIYVDRPDDAWRRRADGRIDMVNDPLDLPALAARAESPWTRFPAAGRIGHIHLRVGDLNSARDFYEGALGMALMAETPGAAFFGAGGYHHHISANIWSSAGAGPRETPRTGLARVTLSADAAAFSALAARNGSRAAELSLKDPWNTPITVAARAG